MKFMLVSGVMKEVTPGDFFSQVGDGIVGSFKAVVMAGLKGLGGMIKTFLLALWEQIVDSSDVLMLLAVIAGVFGIFGSKRAWKWVYWILAVYIVIQTLGLYGR